MNAWAFCASAPGEAHSRRYARLIPFLESHFGNRKVRILEIGVYMAGFSSALALTSRLQIASYTGVDPYLGDTRDPYLGAYWNSKTAAHGVFQQACDAFMERGWTLHRKTSAEFFAARKDSDEYDLIYVDGDHRYREALWDMRAFFPMVAENGLLGIDDYANVDTPDVTRATNDFLKRHQRFISAIAGVESWFINSDKILPVVQVSVFVKPLWTNQAERRELEAAARRDIPQVSTQTPTKGGGIRHLIRKVLGR